MVEYYLKFYQKNIRKVIAGLIREIENFFQLEKIQPSKSLIVYFPELEGLVSSEHFQRINDLYFTIEQIKDKHPFLEKYVSKTETNLDKEYRYADLFACCGGLSLGLQNAGFNLSFVNEINPVFAETFYFNHNLKIEQYFIGDVHELIADLSPFNTYVKGLSLVAGSPPCQGFSSANQQRIIDDPINHLYKAYLEFLAQTKPKFFLMENVKGMSKKIGEILDDFREYIGDDYDIDHSLLNARDFGIPQHRERFFVIGNSIGVESKKIFDSVREIIKKKEYKFVLKDALAGMPELKPNHIKNNISFENEDVGFTMCKFSGRNTKYSRFINNERKPKYIFNHKNRYNNKRDIEIFRRLPRGENSLHHSIADIMPYKGRNHIFKDKYFKLNEKHPSKTITSHMRFDCNTYIHPMETRGLSPREAARIQTFPDDFYFRGSQNQWYAQIGNAVPVKMAEIIGREIIKHLS